MYENWGGRVWHAERKKMGNCTQSIFFHPVPISGSRSPSGRRFRRFPAARAKTAASVRRFGSIGEDPERGSEMWTIDRVSATSDEETSQSQVRKVQVRLRGLNRLMWENLPISA